MRHRVESPGVITPGPDGNASASPTIEAPAEPIANEVVDEAIGWFVRQASGQQTASEQQAFEHWLDRDPSHQQAWQRLRGLGTQLRDPIRHVQPTLVRTTLSAAARTDARRRQALKHLGSAAGIGAALYLAQRELPWRALLATSLADASTGTGERRRLELPDGSSVVLNTATAIDIDFDANARRLVLLSGELLLESVADSQARPLLVQTDDGLIRLDGERFTVRRDGQPERGGQLSTRLTAWGGQADISPRDGAGLLSARIGSGQQIQFTRRTSGPIGPANDRDQAWADGMFVAIRMRLDQFVADLGRYRPGRMRCANEVAGLRITGTWPLNGPDASDRILASLERRLPVRVRRISPWWVTVQAA